MVVSCATVTLPPALMSNEPLPPLVDVLASPATDNRPAMFHVEPAPSIVAAPVEPVVVVMSVLETAAPLRIFRVPLPLLPMRSSLLLCQVELAPVTVTEAVPKGRPPARAMLPLLLETLPPFLMVRLPEPCAPR